MKWDVHLHLSDAFIQSDLQCIQVIHLLSVCVPWELNPRPFAPLTQCSTTEPQEHLCTYCLDTISILSWEKLWEYRSENTVNQEPYWQESTSHIGTSHLNKTKMLRSASNNSSNTFLHWDAKTSALSLVNRSHVSEPGRNAQNSSAVTQKNRQLQIQIYSTCYRGSIQSVNFIARIGSSRTY